MNGREILRSFHRGLRSQIRTASRLSYSTARAWYHRDLLRASRKAERRPVLIYQMGKVGSMSIVASLRACTTRRPILHVHTLLPERLERIEARGRSYFRTHREGKLLHVWQSQFVLKTGLLEGRDQLDVVTLTRDPVARNVSTFFEHIESRPLDDDRWHVVSPEYDFELEVRRGQYDRLVELFLERCRHDSPVEFFDREILRLFRVHLLAEPFDREKGFALYETAKARFLVIRLSDLNRCHAEAFAQLIPGCDFRLENRNVGASKEYADLYKEFKSSIRLPEEYLDRMYNSRYAEHFYSGDEREAQRAHWV